ncbi:MAG: GH25 family lysozyme [Clostridia bacterium]|nr:GH25 family lysozyme [Clostridia bacterium]
MKKGIDVSYAQGNIDFKKIDKNQVNFAIIRSSYGWEKNQKDKEFDRNIKGFQSLGIPCGAYHYSYAKSTSDAVKEAKYCIECIKGYDLQLPVFYDMEENSVALLGKKTCTEIAKAFCNYMKQHGYKTGVYLNPNWIKNYIDISDIIKEHDLWLAQWDSEKPSYKCDVWQYKVGGKGSIKGISGQIDLNYMYKEYEIKTPSANKPSQNSNAGKNPTTAFKVGDVVEVLKPINYDNGQNFIVYDGVKYTVIEAVRNRIVIGIDGQVTAAVDAKNIRKITPTTSKKKTYTYVVKKGDTLTAIAEKYHTTVSSIAKENGIKNPDLIFVNQVLKITV